MTEKPKWTDLWGSNPELKAEDVSCCRKLEKCEEIIQRVYDVIERPDCYNTTDDSGLNRDSKRSIDEWEEAHGHDFRLRCEARRCLLFIDPADIRQALNRHVVKERVVSFDDHRSLVKAVQRVRLLLAKWEQGYEPEQSNDGMNRTTIERAAFELRQALDGEQ